MLRSRSRPLDGQRDLQGADAHGRVRQSHQSLEGAINERRPKQEAELCTSRGATIKGSLSRISRSTVPFHLQPCEALPFAFLDLHLRIHITMQGLKTTTQGRRARGATPDQDHTPVQPHILWVPRTL